LTAALESSKAGTQDTETDTDEGGEDEGNKPTDTPAEEEETVTLKKSEYDGLQRQVSEYRSLSLSQKRQLANLDTAVKRLERNQGKLVATATSRVSDDDDEDLEDKGGGEGDKPTKVELEGPGEAEQIEAELKQISAERGGMYDLMLEQMLGMEQYKDVADVCSESNTQDIVAAVADQLVKDQGIDFGLAALRVEQHIWTQPNPYKYLYGLIKEYHPSYTKEASPETGEAGKTGEEGKTGKPKDKTKGKPPAAPGSIAPFTGSQDAQKTGWTAERIDNLPEDELGKVPPEIYDKYLAGELD
jgi:hypothetical protein